MVEALHFRRHVLWKISLFGVSASTKQEIYRETFCFQPPCNDGVLVQRWRVSVRIALSTKMLVGVSIKARGSTVWISGWVSYWYKIWGFPWGYPNSCMVYEGKSYLSMDDDLKGIPPYGNPVFGWRNIHEPAVLGYLGCQGLDSQPFLGMGKWWSTCGLWCMYPMLGHSQIRKGWHLAQFGISVAPQPGARICWCLGSALVTPILII